MKSGAILGLALLAAFIVYCFRRGEPARTIERSDRRTPRRAAHAGSRTAASGAVRHRHVHEGDPSVRH